jgi:hypothetical protein
MDNLRRIAPVFYSPKFWGIVVTVAAIHLADIGFISERLFEFVYQVSLPATIVGVAKSIARDIGKKK